MIDFHCHLDLFENPKNISALCDEAGIYVLSVTTTPSAWKGTNALTQEFSRIQTALGLHPEIVHERIHELVIFEELIPNIKYVGEIGLDGSETSKPHMSIQKKAFKTVLDLVTKVGGRIMSIHSRGAAEEVLTLLSQYPNSGIPILHWFSGTKFQLNKAVDRGCWFSVGPAMLHSKKARELIKLIPLERLLTETDGPFTKCGNNQCTPLDTIPLLTSLSKLLGMDKNDLKAQLLNNLSTIKNIY